MYERSKTRPKSKYEREKIKMKKIIALILAGLMLLTFVACTPETPETPDVDSESDSVTESEVVENQTPDKIDTSNVSLEAVATDLINKYAEYTGLRQQYDDYMASLEDDEYATEEDKSMTYEQFASYQLTVTPMEKGAEWLMGFHEVPTGFSECYNYAPGMMSPFMGYVFRVEEGTDIEEFKKFLTENCDLVWMICRAANTVVCESYGDIVVFQMMVVINDEMPDGFTEEQKQGFIDTFNTAVKTPIAE